MNLLTIFRRSPITQGPSPALIRLQSAIDGFADAIADVENVVEVGAQARLSCIGMTIGDVATIGAAHRTSSVAFVTSMFNLERARIGLDTSCQDANQLRPDERNDAILLLSRMTALQARMAEIIGITSNIR